MFILEFGEGKSMFCFGGTVGGEGGFGGVELSMEVDDGCHEVELCFMC